MFAAPMSRIQTLTSARTPAVQHARAAAPGAIPDETVVDGNKLVEEALDAGLAIVAAAWSERLLKARNGHDLKRRLEQKADTVWRCSDAVLGRMSSLETHQGVLAIVATPRFRTEDVLGGAGGVPLVVAAVGVKDPGNLGAIVRTTEAAGGTGFLALRGGADPFRDKAVRGSSGSVLRLPVVRGLDEAELLALVGEHRLQLVVADPEAPADYLDVDWTKPTVVALGSEGSGMRGALVERATVAARVPIAEKVDSLNVAVTAGVMLYEARRQRRP